LPSHFVGPKPSYFQPTGGGAETQVVTPGDAINPSISKGVIVFEDRAGGPGDIFAYVIRDQHSLPRHINAQYR